MDFLINIGQVFYFFLAQFIKALRIILFSFPFCIISLPFLIYFIVESVLHIVGRIQARKYNYKNYNGYVGELLTEEQLAILPKEDYTVLNDIMILVNDYTCQIDHIVVSKYGIFVIETKQYHGYITGGKYDKRWVRRLSRGKHLYYLNPISQNYGHIKSLCVLLGLPEKIFINIVSFPGNVRLNIDDDGDVVRYGKLVKKILSYQEVKIDNPLYYVDIINKNNITDRQVRKEHNEYVDNRKKTFNEYLCPKCGGEMHYKQGENGIFACCSNYPECKYTRDLK